MPPGGRRRPRPSIRVCSASNACPNPRRWPPAGVAGSPVDPWRCTSGSSRTSGRPARHTPRSWSTTWLRSRPRSAGGRRGGPTQRGPATGDRGLRGRPVRQPPRVHGRRPRAAQQTNGPSTAGEGGEVPTRTEADRPRRHHRRPSCGLKGHRGVTGRSLHRPPVGQVGNAIRNVYGSRRPRSVELLGVGRGRHGWAAAWSCAAPPVGSFSAVIVPPSAFTTWATMARPRPEPGKAARRRGAVEAIEDVRQVVRSDAGAVVAHDHGAVGALHRHGLARGAPLPGVVEQVADGAATAGPHAPRPSRVRPRARRSRRRLARACWRRRRRRARADRDASGSAGAGSWSPRASSARSPTMSVSSWSWTRTSSTSTERSSSLSSSTRRITSRLVRSEVSGVRSSCDASSTRRLWARRDDSSASSRRLKVRRNRPSSSGPPGVRRRVTSVVSARSSTVSVSEFSGTSAVRATRYPSTTARTTPLTATAPRNSASFFSSDACVQQGGDLQGATVVRGCPTGTCVFTGRCSTNSRSSLPSTSMVVKNDGANPFATRRTCPVTGRPPP